MAALQSWPMCHSILSLLPAFRIIKNCQKISSWQLNYGVLTEGNFQKTASFAGEISTKLIILWMERNVILLELID